MIESERQSRQKPKEKHHHGIAEIIVHERSCQESAGSAQDAQRKPVRERIRLTCGLLTKRTSTNQ